MKKKKRRVREKQPKSSRFKLTVALTILLLIAVGFIMVWKVFVVQNVEVEGNEIYEDEQIQEWVLNDDYSWSTLYVYFKHKFVKEKDIPFVESMSVSIKSPQTLQVDVVEKGILGYVYLPSTGLNAYFDKDGYVVEMSEDIIEGIPKVIGMEVTEEPVIYTKLSLKKTSILRTLLSLTQLLKKYEAMPEFIYIDGSSILLSYGDIQVDVGTGTNLSDKIQRMVQILPMLKGKTGTLHLNVWNQDSTDLYFKKYELVEIPEDQGIIIVDPNAEEEEEEEKPKPKEEPEEVEEEEDEDETVADETTSADGTAYTDPSTSGTYTDPATGVTY